MSLVFSRLFYAMPSKIQRPTKRALDKTWYMVHGQDSNPSRPQFPGLIQGRRDFAFIRSRIKLARNPLSLFGYNFNF